MLQEFGESVATLPLDNGAGGIGLPDPDILPWCAKLNSIDGVCTLQSCAGHSGRYVQPGHLWLWLSEDLALAFHKSAPQLAESNLMEAVSTTFTNDGKEIAVITFAGNDRDRLTESMNVILSFFQSLSVERHE